MLTRENNELICRVGAQTPMGKGLRRYWLPVMQSSDLPAPDCDPFPLEILGDRFVAFRNTDGLVGILDEHCRHRQVSLVIGRCEGNGIRCLFHGWTEIGEINMAAVLTRIYQLGYRGLVGVGARMVETRPRRGAARARLASSCGRNADFRPNAGGAGTGGAPGRRGRTRSRRRRGDQWAAHRKKANGCRRRD